MLTTGRPHLTRKEWEIIDEQLIRHGFGLEDYTTIELTIITDVKCPICNQTFIVSRLGNSIEIRCQTENCLCRTLRGI